MAAVFLKIKKSESGRSLRAVLMEISRLKINPKGVALLEVMVAVSLLAVGVVTALQTIAASAKLSLYASQLQRGCLSSLEWLDLAYQKGHTEALHEFSKRTLEDPEIAREIKPTFSQNEELSTPGFDAYDVKLEVYLKRIGKEDTLVLKSLLLEKNNEPKKTDGFDLS